MLSTEINNLIKFKVNKDHSLLFTSKDNQTEWLKKINSKRSLQPMVNEIKEEANRLLQESNQELTFSLFGIFEQKGSRLEYEKVYFARRRRLNTFAIMALLEPENPIYLEELQNSIWSICNEFTWCLPAHLKNSAETSKEINYSLQRDEESISIDLFAAETAFTLSEVLSLTKDSLDPLICKRIHQEIYRRIFWPFHYQQQFGWENATHNWAAVCAGSIGSAALNLLEDPNELSNVLEHVLHTMNCYLEGFNDDGACMEGYGYWQYGFGYYVYFADLLMKKTDGAINLFTSEKVHQIALFQQKCFINNDTVVNFSDSPPKGSVFLGLSHYLKKIYSDLEVPEAKLRAAYTEDHCSRWAPAIRNLIWFDEQMIGKPWGETTYYLSDSQWLISRNQTAEGSYSFATKGGHNAEPHNHNDIGHFILHGKEEVFLKDLGSGVYNDKYFGDGRYSFLCNGSQGHSVPIINQEFQKEGVESRAIIQNVSLGDKIEIIEMDLVNGYQINELQQLIRKFTWIKGKQPQLVLEDDFLFTGPPTSIVERLITPVIKITEKNEGIVLHGTEDLFIEFNRKQLELTIKRVEFVNHFGKKEENLALDFSVMRPAEREQVKFVCTFNP